MKKIKEMLRRIGTAGLAAIMLTAQMPVTASAEEIEEPQAVVVSDDVLPGESEGGIIEGTASEESDEDILNASETDDEAVQAGAAPLAEQEASEVTADEESSDTVEKQEEEERPAFSESKSIDGVKITVTAAEGVFPEGATLSVEKVTVAQEKQAEEAVEEKRPEEQNVAASYTYDIKVFDKNGNEIQPADQSKVKVSFVMEEVADSNLDTNVYHITEKEDAVHVTAGAASALNPTSYTAEKLSVETDGDTATAETDGFSLYTVEFTYTDKQYVLPGDSEVALSEVLDTVGLTGEVSAVEVSDESLFSAKKCKTADGNTPEKDGDGNAVEDENGTWFVFANQAFSSKEWMKVTIGGVVYEIIVTDDNNLSGSDNYTAQDGDVLTGSTSGTVTIANNAKITLSDATITGGIVCEGTAEITLVGENAVGVTSIDDTLIYKTPGIKIGGTGTTLTIKGDGSMNVTGGSQSAGIGLGRTWDDDATGGSIVIEGGTVTASGEIGIGTGRVGNSKTAALDGIIIKGGTVNASLGSGYIYNGSSVTIGTIKIYDGIEKVDASKITTSVTYMHVENETATDVTSSASTYFTIIEDGDRRIIEKKDDTDYSITIADGIEHGSIAYAATTAKYGEKITITATPDFGYRLSRLVVKDAENNDVASTGNSFFMPKGDVTVSAVFEQGTHGTTEFAWGYFELGDFVTEATIYDGVTTVNLQRGQSYQILEYDNEYSYRTFLLDNDTYAATIPYSGGTGTFPELGNGTNFNVDYNGESGFYDITMTDVGNGKWSVSILKTVGVIENIPDQPYTGSEIKPEPLVQAGSLSLTKGTDYEYSYTDNTNVGTATVTVTFKGDYSSLGSVEKEFNIVHIHSFTYSASGTTITATCSAADCTLTDKKTTLGITAPTLAVYGESGNAEAMLDGLDAFNDATGLSIAQTDIKYVGRGNTTYAESNTAPADAGTYTASITVGGKTANVDYEIAKAEPNIGIVTAEALNDSTDSSGVVLTRTVTTVSGTLALTSTSLRYGTNENCTWRFTPTDTTNYETITGTVDVTVNDTLAPTGEVSIKESTWSTFLNTITFGWYKLTDKVTITATDDGSGVEGRYYFISESETPLSEETVKAKADGEWTAYNSSFSIPRDMKCIIYVKIVDKQGNETYISSNGLEFDGTAPSISGATDGASYVYGTPVALSVTDGGELATVKVNDTTENVSGTYSKTVSDVGSYTITATDKAGNSSVISFSITKAPITLSVSIEGWTYGEVASAPLVTGNSGNGSVTYQYKVKGATDSTYTATVPTDAGAYTVRATVPATANYQGGSATADFTISKKSTTVELPDITRSKGASVANLSVSVASSVPLTIGKVSGYIVDGAASVIGAVTVSNAAVSTAGEVTATLNGGQAGDTITIPVKVTGSNYDCTIKVVITLNNLADPVYTSPTAKSLTYTGSAQALVTAGSVQTGGAMQYSSDGNTWSTSIPTGTGVGDYTIYYRVLETDTVNGVDTTAIHISIARKQVTVKADNKSKTKGASDPTLTATVSGTIGNDTVTYALVRTAGEEVGSYVITASGDPVQGNYSVSFVNGTFTIKSAGGSGGGNSGGGNGGSSGSSDNSGSSNQNNNTDNSSNTNSSVTNPTIPVIPVIPINDDPVPAPQIPVIDLRPQETITDPGNPFIEGHPDQDGWDVIKDKLQDAISEKLSNPDSEGKVVVDMNGASVVSGDVLDGIRGQDVTVVFDLGDGIKWTINGMDITGDNIGDIDFAVSVGTNAIPVDVVNNITGERYSIQISLAHDGNFGFTATLSVDMDKENAGLYANLFYYNTDTKELEFICADEISEDGTAELTFIHASDYTIVIDTEPMDGSLAQADVLADTAAAGSNVQGTGTQSSGNDMPDLETVPDKDAWNPWWIIVLCGMIIAIGLGGFYVIKKKREY